MKVTIRAAASKEEATGFHFPLTEGLQWNCAISDRETFFDSVADGFLVAVAEEGEHAGKVVGCIVCSVYDNNTGWLGPFLVLPELQRRGLGAQIFRAGLEHFQNKGCKVVGLDAVLNMAPSYEKKGFQTSDHIVSFSAALGALMPKKLKSARVMSDHDVDFEALVALDLGTSGLERRSIWQKAQMHKFPGNFGFYFAEEHGNLSGYTLLRPFTKGFRLGPVFAHDEEMAKELVLHAFHALTGQPDDSIICVDVLKSNAEAVAFFHELGFDVLVEYAHMWNPQPPPEQQRKPSSYFALLDATVG